MKTIETRVDWLQNLLLIRSWPIVLMSPGCYYKIPMAGWLQKQKLTYSSAGWEVQNQDARMIYLWWEPSSWLLDDVFSCYILTCQIARGRISLTSLLTRTSSWLNIPLKTPLLNTIMLGIIDSRDTFVREGHTHSAHSIKFVTHGQVVTIFGFAVHAPSIQLHMLLL